MITRFLADHCLNEHILKALRQQRPNVEIVRARDDGVELEHADDATVIAWATAHGHVLLTHDKTTIAPLVDDIIRTGGTFSGVIFIAQKARIEDVLGDLDLIIQTLDLTEMRDQRYHLPWKSTGS